MAASATTKHASDEPVIPDRLYFKIGDVAQICGVETYVLRFWETQFPQLKPNKSGTGQRLYRRREVELALEIKRLVHEEGYTLAGARQALEGGQRRRPAPAPVPAAANPASAAPPQAEARSAAIAHVKTELREIAAMLANPLPAARAAKPRLIKVRPDSESLFPM